MADLPSFRIDLSNECLWRTDAPGENERLDLPPKTFQLLRYLLANKGRAIGSDELLDALWQGVHVQPEVVKTHILAIRNALDDRSEKPRFIETVRGRGYRFIGSIGDVSAFPLEASQSGDPLFVGRDTPLEALMSRFRQAQSGRLQLVFLSGEPGLGKSTVVRKFLAQLSVSSSPVVGYGQCIEGLAGTEPYYPILEALAVLCAGALGTTVLRSLITLAPSWAVQMPAHVSHEQRLALQPLLAVSGRERMLREGCELLERLASQRTIILVLENIHWSDYATLDFLSAISRRRSAARLLIIATYRPEDADGRHPLRGLVHDLVLNRYGSEIALQPLTESAVAAFIGDDPHANASKAFAHLLREWSGGNPLFMQATLDHLAERGLVARRPDGSWHLQTPAESIKRETPPTLGRLIETRFEWLPETERRILEAASVTGLQFCASVAVAATDLDFYAFEDACESLCRRMLFIQHDGLRLLPGGRQLRQYRFRHDIYRQVLYDLLGPARLSRLHAAIGSRLEAVYPPDERDPVAGELAGHFARAAEWQKALTYFRIALRIAIRRFAYSDALAMLDRADDLTAGLPAEIKAATEIEFLDRRAAIYVATHDRRAAEAHAVLLRRATELGDVDMQARCLLRQAQVASWRDKALCLRLLKDIEALSARQQSPTVRALTRLNVLIRRIWIDGWNGEDVRLCEETVAFLRAEGESLTTARAMIDFGMIGVFASRYREVCQSLRVDYQYIIDHANYRDEPDIPRALWMHDIGVPVCLLFLGDFAGSLAAFDEAVARYEANGNHSESRGLKVYRALVYLFTGKVDAVFDTCRVIADAVREQRVADPAIADMLPIERRLSLVLCALAEIAVGHHTAARGYLTAAEDEMNRQAVLLDWYWRLAMEFGWVNLSLAEGNVVAAQEHAEELVGLAEQTDERTWRALAWDALARVAIARDAPAESLRHVASALDVSEGFETPLATWQVHETAAAAYAALDDAENAAKSTELSASARLALVE